MSGHAFPTVPHVHLPPVLEWLDTLTDWSGSSAVDVVITLVTGGEAIVVLLVAWLLVQAVVRRVKRRAQR